MTTANCNCMFVPDKRGDYGYIHVLLMNSGEYSCSMVRQEWNSGYIHIVLMNSGNIHVLYVAISSEQNKFYLQWSYIGYDYNHGKRWVTAWSWIASYPGHLLTNSLGARLGPG